MWLNCCRPGWARARRSWRVRWWRTTPPLANCAPSRRSCSAAVSMESPKPRGMCRSACFASSCCTLTARISPTCPTWTRRARLAEAVTLSDRLRLTTALEVATPAALDAMFDQAVADGSEGLVCKSTGSGAIYQAGARGWLWIKLKRDYRTELADTVDLVVVGAHTGRGRRRGTYGAVLLAAYDPDAEVYQTVGRCGTGFSDTELSALPARLAPLRLAQRPVRVDSRVPADVWFEPSLVLEVLVAELTLSPNHTAGRGQLKDQAGLSMRFPRFTGRWRDDKEPQDATTTQQLIDLYRTARREHTGA